MNWLLHKSSVECLCSSYDLSLSVVWYHWEDGKLCPESNSLIPLMNEQDNLSGTHCNIKKVFQDTEFSFSDKLSDAQGVIIRSAFCRSFIQNTWIESDGIVPAMRRFKPERQSTVR